MDVLRKYIKMCEKATEIQAQFQKIKLMEAKQARLALRGYFMACDSHKPVFTFWFGFHLIDDVSNWQDQFSYWIWLPRQDQLQTMIGDFDDCLNLIDRFDCMSAIGFDYPNVISMEQLWLSILMKEKYNKKWNGKNWEEK